MPIVIDPSTLLPFIEVSIAIPYSLVILVRTLLNGQMECWNGVLEVLLSSNKRHISHLHCWTFYGSHHEDRIVSGLEVCMLPVPGSLHEDGTLHHCPFSSSMLHLSAGVELKSEGNLDSEITLIHG